MGRSFNETSGTVQSFHGAEILGAVVAATLGVSVNNYDPPGGRNTSLLLLSASTPINITGLTGATGNRQLTLMNTGAAVITLKANSGSSSAGNKFNFQSDVALAQYETVQLIANVAASGWVLVQDVLSGGGAPTTATYITENDETAALPNSLRLAAGTNITLTPAGSVMTIAASGGGSSYNPLNIADMPAAIANNYAPAGWNATVTDLYQDDVSFATPTITGFAALAAGTFIRIWNVGSGGAGVLTLATGNVGSIAANRFAPDVPVNVTISVGRGVGIIYDGVASRWRILAP